jgi:hypothetical protein
MTNQEMHEKMIANLIKSGYASEITENNETIIVVN